MRFHCLFEQSGIFKNVFKSYGHEAWDYDILNDYGETLLMYDKEYNTKSIRSQDRSNYMTARSQITPRYADNFYKRFIEQQIKERTW